MSSCRTLRFLFPFILFISFCVYHLYKNVSYHHLSSTKDQIHDLVVPPEEPEILITTRKPEATTRKLPATTEKKIITTKKPEEKRLTLAPFTPKPYNWSTNVSETSYMECVPTKNEPTFQICIHEPSKDIFISRKIKDNKIWEPHIMKLMAEYQQKYPKVTFMDLGANIGPHSLYAASLKMPVISVEANAANWAHLHKAVLLNDFQNRITLFPYALSETRRVFKMFERNLNVGATFLKHSDMPQTVKGGANDFKSFDVESILLTDLLPFIKTETVIIKMDVEAHECFVIRSSKEFFQKKHVPLLVMETQHLNLMPKPVNPCVKDMFDSLKELNYTVIQAQGRNEIKINENYQAQWPQDSAWILKH